MRAKLQAIIAIGRDNSIGQEGKLPWHIPADLKRFKQITNGHAIIMGRKTHESIGKALSGRRNIVVSRNHTSKISEVETFSSVTEAVLAALETDETPFVIGGAAIYQELWPLVKTLHLTEVDENFVEADTFFEFDAADFQEVWREDHFDNQPFGYSFVTYERIPPIRELEIPGVITIAPSSAPDARRQQLASVIAQGIRERLKPFVEKKMPLNEENARLIKHSIVGFMKEMEDKGELPRADIPDVCLITKVTDPTRIIICDAADLEALYQQGLIPSHYKVWT